MELKLIHDFVVKPALRTVPGVAEVNASGGYEKQIVVQPRPDALLATGVTLGDLAEVVGESVENAGGGSVQLGGEQITIRAASRVQTAEEIAQLPLKFRGAAADTAARARCRRGGHRQQPPHRLRHLTTARRPCSARR
jgi:cobalt-zinc-cadmium resistance protein CzcA